MSPAFTEALLGRYVLERELGRGGMATVYLARDVRHERLVALKVLHPELAWTLGPERFQREIKLCARLQHPHILTVHDSGEAAGQLWFTMPYVEGESLRTALIRERQLPVNVALRIATDAARALEYAHQHGVIHRDIKPENLLITTDGSTLVADFGIARALSAETEALTQTGMSVGTPAYMSPEQASGETNLDSRTDVYALGAVLYEMLAGEPPYTGPSAQAIMAKQFSDPIPRVRRLRPAVPETVDQCLVKALAAMPADRFATASEFAEAFTRPVAATAPVEHATRPAPLTSTAFRKQSLRWPIAAAIALAVAAALSVGLLVGTRADDSATPSADGLRRLAVLPFENLGDSADAYFADGVTDAVRGKLSALPGLQVIARSSSSQYRKSVKTPQQIGQELGVQYLLTATVRWEKVGGKASRVQVTPELVQAASASTKWQQPFDASLTGVFQVQADIAGRVAEALDLALGDSARQELAEKPTQNLSAYDAYLKGEEVFQTTEPRKLRQAAAYYAQAVKLDSGFVQAWAQLSRAYSGLSIITTPTPAQSDQARRAAERALALSPGRPEGHLAMCNYYWGVVKDNVSALKECERGLKLAPNDVDLLTMSALAEKWLGRWEAALTHLQQAQRLEPRSVGAASGLAEVLLWQRRYPEARVANGRARSLAPRDLGVLEGKAMIALAEGDLAEARAVINAAPKEVDRSVLVAFLANYWDLFWVLDDAQQLLLLELGPDAFDNNRGAWGIVRAQTYWLRGDRGQARIYADSARIALEPQVRAAPRDEQLHVFYGLALAYLGRKAEAVHEGQRAIALLPIAKDAFGGAYMQHQLARIYLLVGEPDKALDHLEPLLNRPYYLSPAWLRIDPTFDPLRKHPRFDRLVEGDTKKF
jgi:serine/threonine-protein kinase